MWQKLICIYDRFYEGIEALGALLAFLILVFISYSVFCRTLGVSSTFSEELTRYFLTTMILLSASLVLKNDKHVRVEFLLSRLNQKPKLILIIVSDVMALVFFYYVLLSGIDMTALAFSWNLLSETDLRVPLWIPQSAVAISAGLLILQTIFSIIQNIRELHNK